MDIIAQYGTIFILITAVFGFIMAFGIGANDVSNAMGTSVGSKVINIRQAIIIAVIFEFAGAYLAGGEVANTIKGGIVDINHFIDRPDVFALGMMAALFAAGVWLLIASRYGWPVSTTHSIIGAVIGFSCISVGPETVKWASLLGIIGSWFITPVLAGVIAYFIFRSTQKIIFDSETPMENAKKYGPFYFGLTVFVVVTVTLKKGLKHMGFHLTWPNVFVISALIASFFIVLCYFYFRTSAFKARSETSRFSGVERIFSTLMIVTACAMAFAHGSNDVANAIGPLSAVVAVVESGGTLAAETPIAPWILPLGGAGIVVGLVVLGYKVMGTIGTGITELTPSRGFAAQFACASTVVIASGTGLPISTTQTLVGAILGVGFARGIAAINMSVIRNIIMSWVITLPAGAIMAMIIYEILQIIF